jgi:CheY-like chemotaxis protein
MQSETYLPGLLFREAINNGVQRDHFSRLCLQAFNKINLPIPLHLRSAPKPKTGSMTKGPIVIVDDDRDDQEIYGEAIKAINIPNELRFFDGGEGALQYLYTTPEQPFIILSDVNMPLMNGLEFKGRIQEDEYLRNKGIPFVFISTNANKSAVRQAHVLSVQGYFQKPNNMEGIKKMLRTLFDYWELCRHVNNTI